MISGLHHIAVLCSEKERTRRFYETLGFSIRESHVRPERHDEVIIMDGHGITLELFIAKDYPARVTNPEAYGLRHLALKVADIRQAVHRIAQAGYDPEPIRRDAFTGEKMTFVKDPDGLPIELHE